MRRAVCPGSFDPVTNGHIDIVSRTSQLFDEVVVAIGINKAKASARLFTAEERIEMLEKACADFPNVTVAGFDGLLTTFCERNDIRAIVKGLRAVSDFDYELQMAQMNSSLAQVETIFIPTSPEYSFLASSLVKEVAMFGGDVSGPGPAVRAGAVDSPGSPRSAPSRRARSSSEGRHRRPAARSEGRSGGGPLGADVGLGDDQPLRVPRPARGARAGDRHDTVRRPPRSSATARRVSPNRSPRPRRSCARPRPSARCLISTTDVYRLAQARAEEITDSARKAAAELQAETDEYVEAKLANFELTLERTLDLVRRGRAKLSGGHSHALGDDSDVDAIALPDHLER